MSGNLAQNPREERAVLPSTVWRSRQVLPSSSADDATSQVAGGGDQRRRVIKEARILLSSRASEELSGHIIGLSRPCGHPRNYAGQAPPFAPETVAVENRGAKSFAVNYFKWLVGSSTGERERPSARQRLTVL